GPGTRRADCTRLAGSPMEYAGSPSSASLPRVYGRPAPDLLSHRAEPPIVDCRVGPPPTPLLIILTKRRLPARHSPSTQRSGGCGVEVVPEIPTRVPAPFPDPVGRADPPTPIAGGP